MREIQKIVGWGYGSAYTNCIKEFPILENAITEFVDSDSKKHCINNNISIQSPEILKKYDKSTTLIIVFSEFFDEIILNENIVGFENVISVWELKREYQKYIPLILEVSTKNERKLLSKMNNHCIKEEIFYNLYNYFKKYFIKGINLGDLLKTEFHYISKYIKDDQESCMLFEINIPTKLEFAILGDGPILVSSLMYGRYDHIELMNKYSNEVGVSQVTRILYYDDFKKYEKELLNSFTKQITKQSFNICLDNEEINEIKEILDKYWEISNIYVTERVKKWIENHVKLSVGLIELYEQLIGLINVEKAVFIIDYFRDEFILAHLLEKVGCITYTFQHGFYYFKYNDLKDNIWNKVYHIGGAAKKKIVWGKLAKEQLMSWGITEENIILHGNPKYRNIELDIDKYKLPSKEEVFSILLVLGTNKHENENIIKLVEKYSKINPNINIYIKQHPEYKEDLKKSKVQGVIIDNLFDSNILENIHLVITTKSTVYYEMLALNKYTLILINEEDYFTQNKYTCIQSFDDFYKKINNWFISKAYREQYFSNAKQELNDFFYNALL